jgi:hypothetical protein
LTTSSERGISLTNCSKRVLVTVTSPNVTIEGFILIMTGTLPVNSILSLMGLKPIWFKVSAYDEGGRLKKNNPAESELAVSCDPARVIITSGTGRFVLSSIIFPVICGKTT